MKLLTLIILLTMSLTAKADDACNKRLSDVAGKISLAMGMDSILANARPLAPDVNVNQVVIYVGSRADYDTYQFMVGPNCTLTLLNDTPNSTGGTSSTDSAKSKDVYDSLTEIREVPMPNPKGLSFTKSVGNLSCAKTTDQATDTTSYWCSVSTVE